MSFMQQLPWQSHKNLRKVAIVGDLMLDEYLEGQVARISPEAPVPIHLVRGLEQRAGGAANVALNIAKLSGKVSLYGRIGLDKAGEDLCSLLASAGVGLEGLVKTSAPTTRKMRVTAHRHQMIRIDWEKSEPLDSNSIKGLVKQLENDSFQAILLSDYGKGLLSDDLLQDIIKLGLKKKIPVLVDPKGINYDKYQGASLLTPNKNEAIQALGLNPLEKHLAADLSAALLDKYAVGAVLVTLGPEGMYYLDRQGTSFSVPAQAREVFDVSGAGDTVAAVLSLAMAAGTSTEEMIQLANRAGGLVVGKWGTYALSADELLEEIAKDHKGQSLLSSKGKVKDVPSLQQLVSNLQKKGKKVVFTNGCFDLLHEGHVDYLEASRRLGDILVCAVNSDSSVKRLKGPSRPIVPCRQRMRLLAALECVDYVCCFEEDNPLEVIKAVQPDILTKGADWPKDKVIGGSVVEARGGKVMSIDLVEGLSTSAIVEKIRTLQKKEI